jgi:hypothetical protein
MACVIEEVDPASDAMRYEDALERILIDAGRDPTKFLAAVFAFLHAKTRFFAQPDASKALARLLRNVKKAAPATKGVASGFLGAAPEAAAATASGAGPSAEPRAPQTNGHAQVRLIRSRGSLLHTHDWRACLAGHDAMRLTHEHVVRWQVMLCIGLRNWLWHLLSLCVPVPAVLRAVLGDVKLASTDISGQRASAHCMMCAGSRSSARGGGRAACRRSRRSP